MISFWQFYGSVTGKILRRLVRERIHKLWPDLHDRNVLVIGYGVPYLKLFLDNAARTLHFTPRYTEAVAWPPQSNNVTAVVDDIELPLPDVSIDRVVIIHALEHAPLPDAALHEVWRVMNAEAKLLVIVPSRMGLWARSDATPFGAGRPFTERQVRQLLKDNGFRVEREDCALFLPPGWMRARLNFARWIEGMGRKYFPALAGLFLLEAGKYVYAVRPVKADPLRRFMTLPLIRKTVLESTNFDSTKFKSTSLESRSSLRQNKSND